MRVSTRAQPARASAFATGTVRPSARTATLLALALLAHVPVPAGAEVWEYDRRGNPLRTPEALPERHAARSRPPETAEPASRSRAIYLPMAEGVAEVYAKGPAVAGAGLDAAEFVRLFVALIDQESRFNPAAVSPTGARGLGQLMPETAALLGVDAGEPMANLHGAARYLTAQLAEFGRVDLALAAYNAGPERVTQFHGIPPFRETRDYVAKITAAAALASGAPAAAAVPRPAVGRAFVSLANPALETDVVEPASLAAPAQGTVLEWKR